MRIDEITVEVRDSNFDRQGLILPVDLATFKAVLRFNNVGTWSITLPVGHPMAEILRLPGSGIIVTGPNGVLMSGPTISATNTKTGENPNGDWEIQGVDDSQILGERLAYPTPATADVQAQTTAYDTRTGLASTVMYGYVNANIGSAAPAAREITNLYTATDAGLGTTTYAAARFDVLGELLAGIASVDGLGFDIKQVDGNLEFSVYEPADRTGTIRMDVANNTLQKTAYGYGAPSATVAIVAGQGEGADRQFEQVVTTDSTAAQNLWQRRIETFVDQRNTSVVDELVQAGKEELADRGSTVTSIDVVPSSDSTMRYGNDWGLGDAVTVVVGEQEVSATVTTVSISIEADGIRVGATVGEPTGVDYEGLIAKKQTNTSKRVNALERKEGGGGGGGGGAAGVLTQEIKNDQGAGVSLGQAVYISGANGTNVLVRLAQANAESTSSKTMGLLSQDLATNGIGTVVTEGMLGGLDTSAASDGDPVWLSPTTPGGLVYGLANKPVAPDHLVFIGFVLRANANNGEIYVKVQNGFENDELHDRLTFVGDTPPSSPKDYYYWFKSDDGTLFFRYKDADGSQWVEVKNPNNYTGDTAINAFSSRMTAVESSVANVKSGYYIRQLFTEIDTTNRSFSNSWTLAWTGTNRTGFKAGSKIRLQYHMALRNNSGSWGGGYIEPQISFNNSSWFSLGSSGYDGGVMGENAGEIGSYNNSIIIDPALQGVTTDFQVRIRFYAKSYDGTLLWNQDHDINAVSNTATAAADANRNQHFCNFTIEELATGQ
jgi:hypothetical protein